MYKHTSYNQSRWSELWRQCFSSLLRLKYMPSSLKIPPKLISKEPYIFERKINLQCTLFVTQWQDDRLLKNPKAFLTIWAITTSQKIGVWSLNTSARLPPPFKKVLLYLNSRSTGYFIKHLLFQVAKYSF